MIDAMLAAAVAGNPDGAAIVSGDRELRYRELHAQVAGFGQRLRNRGIGPGDHVLIVLPNCPEFAISYFATARIGATVQAVDPGMVDHELLRLVEQTAPAAVVTSPRHAARFTAACVVVVAGDTVDEVTAAEVPGDDVASRPWVTVSSSGSTGAAKHIGRSQANQVAEADNIATSARITHRDVILCPVPLFHALGQFCCLVTAARAGATLVLLDHDSGQPIVEQVVEAVERHGVTILIAVPYLFEALSDLPADRRVDLSSVRLCLSGSNFLAAAVPGRFLARFGVPLRQTYGSTEAGSVSWDVDPQPTPGSVGQPLSGVTVRILDDEGRLLPANVVGEIAVQSAAVITDGFYRTGDLGRLDDEGRLYVIGRTRLQIDTGGRKVNPIEVEDILRQHPSTSDAAVVGLPLRGGGELLAAAVVTASPEPEPLLAHCRARLAPYQVPQRIHFVREIPRSPTGKVRRAHLSDLLAAADDADPALLARLLALPAEQRTAELTDYLAARVADILCAAKENLDPQATLPALGIDSLGALRLRMAVQDDLRLPVELPELLGRSSITSVAERLAGRLNDGPTTVVTRGRTAGEFPLSANQRSLWHAEQMNPDNGVYVLAFAARITSVCDSAALHRACQLLVDRHPVLRTTFPVRDGVPVQRVAEHAPVDFRVVDVPPDWGEALDEEAFRAFDIAAAPALRVRLFVGAARGPVLLVAQHHIITDYWSLVVLLRELAAAYTAELLGRDLYLPAPAHSYTDYGRWLDETAERADLDYWLTQLDPPPPAADLPTDRERPVVRRQRGATFRQELPEACVAALRAYAQSRGTTVYSVLLAAFHVLLHAYTGNDDSAIAVNTANRDRPEFADVLGYFANPIVHRVRVEADEPFAALVDRVSATLLAGLDHQLVTFEQVIGRIGVHRDRGRAPLVEVCFGQNKVQDAGLAGLGAFLSADGRLRLGALACEPIALGKPGVVYDFAGAVYESDDAVAIVWEYDRDLFEPATVRRMTDGFATVLDIVSAAQDTPVRDIAVADVAMLLEASRGASLPSTLPTVVELISRHATENPDAPAVEDDGVVLTRGELAARADAIAAAVGDGPVAVWVSSTADLAVAGLGVLRAGACCVALDSRPDLAEARLLITTAARRESLGALPVPVVDVEHPGAGSRPPAARPDAPALVLRTAGVEGPPRTVVLDHRALSAAAHRGTGGDVLLSDSRSAGRTLATLLTVLACGGTAVSGGMFVAAVGSGRAWGSVAMTPTELARVLEHLDRTGTAPRVDTLVLSGEVLPARLVRRWRAHAAGTRIVHEYGGAGFCVSAGDVPAEVTGVVPVGRPVPGASRYVLDGAGRLCPVGVPGEIYVAEDRTGDIGRYLPNGDLVVLGRAAEFGREHGYRGDPTRVEEALHAIPAVRFAVVAGTTAFVEPAGLNVAQLRTALRQTVPHHLVPDHIVLTDRVPVAGDGKSARFGLSATTDQAEPTPEPATAVETALAAIWAEVLGIDHVGLDDDYYALGGDSVMTIRIATKAAEHGIRLTRRQLFTHPTVRALATVARTDAAPTTLRRSLSRHRTIPLTPIQHWFFDQHLPVVGHWNQTVVVTTGDPTHLRAAMAAVAEHHGAFRFRYRRRPDGWDQVLDPTGDAVGVAETAHDLARAVADAHAGIDIETGPMLRMAIAGDRIVLAAHHLVMDFLSWGVVLDDLARAYRQLRDGEPVRLPAASTPYDVWARRLSEYADSPELRGQLPYWTAHTGPAPATEPSWEGQARSAHRRLSRDETRALLGTRTPRLVLAAVVRAVARETGESTVWADLEGHGREDLFDHVDLTRTVGWFTALYPVAFSVGPSPLRTLGEVHAALDRVPGNGLGYGLLRYGAADPAVRERMAAVPRPAVSVNYLGRLGWLLGDRDGSGLFRPVPAPEGHDRAPGNPRPYRWEFSASVAGEIMTVTLGHAGDPAQAERLLDDVCATLHTLIEGHE